MTVLAAPGDTWGISGPPSSVYLAPPSCIVGTRRAPAPVLAGPAAHASVQLGPQQVAYLNGGEQLAIWASLGGLRGSGAIGVRPDRRLTTAGPPPAGLTPLDQAIHYAARRPAAARELRSDEWVRSALDQLRDGLEQRGLLSTPQRAGPASGTLLLALLAARCAAVLRRPGQRPSGRLAAAEPIPLLRGRRPCCAGRPCRTRAATRRCAACAAQHTHLAPASAPAYATYGAAGAAMGVALYGTASL